MHNKGNTSIIMLSNNIQSFLKRNEDTSIKMDYLFTGLTKQTTSFREMIVNCALQLGRKFLEDIFLGENFIHFSSLHNSKFFILKLNVK